MHLQMARVHLSLPLHGVVPSAFTSNAAVSCARVSTVWASLHAAAKGGHYLAGTADIQITERNRLIHRPGVYICECGDVAVGVSSRKYAKRQRQDIFAVSHSV